MSRLLAPGGADAVAVLLVGDELLLGSVADSNGAWLARTLTAAGLRVVDVEVVPDDVERIVAALVRLSEGAGSVVVSGGIGPTSDDVTRAALAHACGCALVADTDGVDRISGWFRAQGRPVPPLALRMAERPACATLLVNPHGSAPGVRVALGAARVYAVPGVPAELRAMVTDLVLPDLLATAGTTPVVSTTLEVALLGESSVASRLVQVEAEIDADPTAELAYLARPAHVSVRVSVRRPDPMDAQQRRDELVAQAERALGAHVLGRDGASLPAVVLDLLVHRGETVACAESLTGGGVAAALTSRAGSSAAVRGAVVAYTPGVKVSLLGVAADTLAAHGAVHPDVAAQMAVGVRERLGATWGVSTTGVAGPDPLDGHPPGDVVVGVAGPDGVSTATLHVPGERRRVQALSVAHALDRLRRTLLAAGSTVAGESRPTLRR